MPPVIHWFRRDLRIADNTALHRASQAGSVVPVYILSSWCKDHAWTGSNRQQFLCGCLESLSKNLETLNSSLIIRKGPAVSALKQLIKETGATAVHFNRDPDPFAKKTEQELSKLCTEWGIDCCGYDDVALHNPTEILTQTGNPYKVYTPYANNWLSRPKPSPLSKPESLNTPQGISSLPLPKPAYWNLPESRAKLPEPGERAARERMRDAVSKIIGHYAEKRDIPSLDGTSRLSQDLRFGLISIRTLYAKVNTALRSADVRSRSSIEIYIKELAWREFYFAILHHFPHVLEHEFNKDWQGLPWDEPSENFEKWKSGQTGFPIIDAGMRQLLQTGFMHNRLRMVAGSFLVKHLGLDWRWGEAYFAKHLNDFDLSANNGGWQWSAGTGADAAPYFRIQNPWSQTAKHDPTGVYIKRWIPELSDVEPKKFQAPPENGIPLAAGYPLPCVDHKTERDRTLAIFKKHRA